jgi:hypothetical protein
VLAIARIAMPGDEISVPGGTGPLPQAITCVVSSTDGVTEYQKVTVNTSGNVDLFLKDTFGSLQLQSCDANDCLRPVEYTYTIANIGGTPMTITKVNRVRDGQSIDLLLSAGQLINQSLAVGESTFVTEGEVIDVCVDSTSTTTVTAEANPPAAGPCLGTDTYNLITRSLPCGDLYVSIFTLCFQDGINCISGTHTVCFLRLPFRVVLVKALSASTSYHHRTGACETMFTCTLSKTVERSHSQSLQQRA